MLRGRGQSEEAKGHLTADQPEIIEHHWQGQFVEDDEDVPVPRPGSSDPLKRFKLPGRNIPTPQGTTAQQ